MPARENQGNQVYQAYRLLKLVDVPAEEIDMIIEPITLEFVSSILRRERPDAIVPTLGGQTGLNMATELAKSGILNELGIELLGTKLSAIEKAEDLSLIHI